MSSALTTADFWLNSLLGHLPAYKIYKVCHTFLLYWLTTISGLQLFTLSGFVVLDGIPCEKSDHKTIRFSRHNTENHYMLYQYILIAIASVSYSIFILH